jgi:DNA polymerase-1
VQPLLDTVDALGLPLLRIGGVEADDVIGTLAQRAAAAGQRVLISTGDKDMCQLVSEHITLINTMSGSIYDRDGVKAKFDVWPEQIIDYLALVGDTSDNIPGIDKVGPKTAAKWLGQYQTLDNLVAHADEVSGKVGENLRAGLATLELSRQLATIRCDLDLPIEANDLTRRAADDARLREIYTRMEFRALLRSIGGDAASGESSTNSSGTLALPRPRDSMKPYSIWSNLIAGSTHFRKRTCSPLIRKRRVSTIVKRRSSASHSASSPAKLLTFRSPMITSALRHNSIGIRSSRACARC